MLSLLACVALSGSAPAPTFDHVVLLSVDGLHAGALRPPLIDGLPAFARLLRGPHTLDARTDPNATITLPSHVSMVTALPVSVHRWERNDDPPARRHGGTIHAQAGRYVPGIFDVAHDRGVSTALFTGKTKFWLFEQSYGAHSDGGAKDPVPPDDGRAKIDLVVHAARGGELIAQLSARLRRAGAERRRTLDFVHLAEPDVAGHSHEWLIEPGSKYMDAVASVDRSIGDLLAAIDGDDSLRGRVAIVLTTDHGGGRPEKTHTDLTAPCNFVIPFAVWLGTDRAPLDLYAINAGSRTRPKHDELPGDAANPPPIRNGDSGNLALQLLGLPAIPGSALNARQDLLLMPAAEPRPAIPQASARFADVPSEEAHGRPWTWISNERRTSKPDPRAHEPECSSPPSR